MSRKSYRQRLREGVTGLEHVFVHLHQGTEAAHTVFPFVGTNITIIDV